MQRDVLTVLRSLSNQTEVNLRMICEDLSGLLRQHGMAVGSLSWMPEGLKNFAYAGCP